MMKLVLAVLSGVRSWVLIALDRTSVRLASDRGDVPGWVLVGFSINNSRVASVI